MDRTAFYHIQLNNLNTQESLSVCSNYLDDSLGKTVFFFNAHCFNVSIRDNEYLKCINNGSLLLNDGIGVKIAARFKGIKLKENMNGTDFIPKLLKLADKKRKKVFLLGAETRVVSRAKKNLHKRLPKLSIVGISDGFFSKHKNGEQALINQLNTCKPDLLIVGMGVPYQEKWIMENREQLGSVKLFVAGGAILDFIAGRVIRAPKFIQKMGMEWLWRFFQEPKRLFNRYFVGNFVFFLNLIKTY